MYQVKPAFFLILLLSLFNCNDKNNFRIKKSETFFNNLNTAPENLHPIKSTDVYSSIIHSYILESLLERNPNTYEWEPRLAKKWNLDPNGKSFTFTLFDNLKWSDGKELTATDVEFSFLAYKNPAYGGFRYIPYFEKIKSVKVLDKKRVRFFIKEPYFGNFQVIAGMDIIPKHIYEDPKLKMSKTVIGSGPYLLSKHIKGKILVLEKNPHWKAHLNQSKEWNFPTLVFRFVSEDSDTLLRMEKGHLDFTSLTAELFIEKTKEPPWGTKIKKVEYSNKLPSGYGFIGFNFEKKMFQDKRVRRALAHLLNRKLINEKFYYQQVELARGPWYFWSEYADPSIPAIDFNPKKAQSLLKSAGWEDKDKNGILEKSIDGKITELAFTLTYPSGSKANSYLTLYQEDLKKHGIKLSFKVLDWTSFLKLIDDKSFSAVMLGWGGGSIDFDPKQIWHSSSAKNKGSNFINYSNPQVDALIEKGRKQMNRKERIKTFRKIYRLIAEDTPYIFIFNSRKKFYGLNHRIENYYPTLNYDIGMSFWDFKKTVE